MTTADVCVVRRRGCSHPAHCRKRCCHAGLAFSWIRGAHWVSASNRASVPMRLFHLEERKSTCGARMQRSRARGRSSGRVSGRSRWIAAAVQLRITRVPDAVPPRCVTSRRSLIIVPLHYETALCVHASEDMAF